VKNGGPAVAFCRPENVLMQEGESSEAFAQNFMPLEGAGRVISSAFLGESTLYEVELPGDSRWRVLRHETGAQGIPDGAKVRLAVARQAWAVVPETGQK
jgi:hypothetical protein